MHCLYRSVIVRIYSWQSERDTVPSMQIAWKLCFALFNSLYGDYTKRNVIALRALCHCLALSIKLTTIPNPPIVHAEWLLSATVSWSSGENEHSLSVLQQSNHETMQKTLHIFVFFLFPFFPPVHAAPSPSSSSSSSPPLLPLLLFSCSWLLSSLT